LLLKEHVRLLKRTLAENIDIQLIYRPDEYMANADPTRIQQAITNLAVNARDAMPDGGRLFIETANVYLDDSYVSTHAEATIGPHVMLAVSDTGCGMDRETVERIFEPFFTTKHRGTGLGLPIARRVVEAHGGEISVDCPAGGGTTFRVSLPESR